MSRLFNVAEYAASSFFPCSIALEYDAYIVSQARSLLSTAKRMFVAGRGGSKGTIGLFGEELWGRGIPILYLVDANMLEKISFQLDSGDILLIFSASDSHISLQCLADNFVKRGGATVLVTLCPKQPISVVESNDNYIRISTVVDMLEEEYLSTLNSIRLLTLASQLLAVGATDKGVAQISRYIKNNGVKSRLHEKRSPSFITFVFDWVHKTIVEDMVIRLRECLTIPIFCIDCQDLVHGAAQNLAYIASNGEGDVYCLVDPIFSQEVAEALNKYVVTEFLDINPAADSVDRQVRSIALVQLILKRYRLRHEVVQSDFMEALWTTAR